jgi:predicted small lipoprotein YifL
MLLPAAALIAVVLAGTTLSACGQKGPLYLPSQKKSKVPPTQQPQGTPPQGTPPQGTPPQATPPQATPPPQSTSAAPS